VFRSAVISVDVAALVKEIEEKQPDVTIIFRRNNPTGCVISDQDLAVLLKQSWPASLSMRAVPRVAHHSTVPLSVITKTLGCSSHVLQAMAMAALRVGYLLAAPELVREIAKAVCRYNLNALSHIAAEVGIEMFEAKLRLLVESICAERDRLYG